MKHKNDLEFNAKLNGKQKFALRKLTVGLTTVMLGTTFALTSQTAHADETKNGESQTTELVKTKNSTNSGKDSDTNNVVAKPNISTVKADKSKQSNDEQTLDLNKKKQVNSKVELADQKQEKPASQTKTPLVSTGTKSNSDKDDHQNSNITSTVETESRSIQEKVDYVYGNGPHKGEEVYSYPSSNSNKLTFSRNRTHYHNNDTGADTYSKWSDWDYNTSVKSLPDIALPQKARGLDDNHIYKYHVDPDLSHYQETINGQNISANDPLKINFDTKKIYGKIIDPKDVSTVIPENGAVIQVTVPYLLKENITIHYIDEDSKKEIGTKFTTHHDGTKHAPGTTIDNPVGQEVTALTKQNYVLDTDATNGSKNVNVDHVLMLNGKYKNLDTRYDNFEQHFKINGVDYENTLNSKKLTFDNDENPQDKILYVYFTHATKPIQQQAIIRENIKGYYENGPKMTPFYGMDNPDALVDSADQTNTPDITITLQFNRTGTQDLVNGTTSWNNWTANHVTLPAIPFNNTLIKDKIADNYYLDKNGVIHVAYSNYFGGHYLPTSNHGISSLSFNLKNDTDWLDEIVHKEADGKSIATINVWVPYRTDQENGNEYIPPYSDNSNTSYTPDQSSTPSITPSVPVVPSAPSNEPNEPSTSTQSSTTNGSESSTKTQGNNGYKNTSNNKDDVIENASPVASHITNGVAMPNTTEASSVVVHVPNEIDTPSAGTELEPNENDELPQTGDSVDSSVTAVGLGIATLGSILGLAGARKKVRF